MNLCIFIGKFLILEIFYIPAQANQAGQDFIRGAGPPCPTLATATNIFILFNINNRIIICSTCDFWRAFKYKVSAWMTVDALSRLLKVIYVAQSIQLIFLFSPFFCHKNINIIYFSCAETFWLKYWFIIL